MIQSFIWFQIKLGLPTSIRKHIHCMGLKGLFFVLFTFNIFVYLILLSTNYESSTLQVVGQDVVLPGEFEFVLVVVFELIFRIK